jgi:hypothetical protein
MHLQFDLKKLAAEARRVRSSYDRWLRNLDIDRRNRQFNHFWYRRYQSLDRYKPAFAAGPWRTVMPGEHAMTAVRLFPILPRRRDLPRSDSAS